MSDLIDRETVIKIFDRLLPKDTLSKEYEEVFHMLSAIYKIPVVKVNDTPCDLCKYNPPSSMDGKPCTICPAVGRGENNE